MVEDSGYNATLDLDFNCIGVMQFVNQERSKGHTVSPINLARYFHDSKLHKMKTYHNMNKFKLNFSNQFLTHKSLDGV